MSTTTLAPKRRLEQKLGYGLGSVYSLTKADGSLSYWHVYSDNGNQREVVLRATSLTAARKEASARNAKKDSGELPIVGVNTFLDPEEAEGSGEPAEIELARASKEEKDEQIRRLEAFHEKHRAESEAALSKLKAVAAAEGGNVFDELMSAVRVLSLGQITNALYEVGGRYRRAL